MSRRYGLFIISVIGWLMVIWPGLSSPLFSQPLDSLRVVKISSLDKTAVIRTGNSALVLVRVGDLLFDGAIVGDIKENKLILKYNKGDIPETIIIRIRGEGQTVERIRPVPESVKPLYMPGSVSPDNQ